MSISTISSTLGSSSGNGQLVSLSELADISASKDFQSLLNAARKGNSLSAGNLATELHDFFAGKLPAIAIDSVIAALSAGKIDRPGESMQPAGEYDRNGTADALLAAIAQAMSGQMVTTHSPQPSDQDGTPLTLEEGAKQAASPRTSRAVSVPSLSDSFQRTIDLGGGLQSEGLRSGNSTLFQVDRSNPAGFSNISLPNAAAIASPSTTKSNIPNTVSPTFPSNTTEARLPSEPSVLSYFMHAKPTPLADNGALEDRRFGQFENTTTHPENKDIRPLRQSFAELIAPSNTLESPQSEQLSIDSLKPLTELRTEAANTAGTLASPAPLLTSTAQHSRGAELQTLPAAINAPLYDRTAWSQDFGDRIVWMAKQDQQSAEIRITPANLGPVQISLNIEDGKANAVFVSPHAEVCQALEEALPRLREMLNASGISLGQANVGSQMPQQQPDSAARFAAIHRNSGENAILSAIEGNGSSTSVLPIRQGRGMVDLFA